MTKQIPLTQGRFALVDDEDYDYLMQWKWQFHSKGYARRRSNGKNIYMHRIINKTPDGLITDHINRDPLDNRKLNLRTCTNHQNLSNVEKTCGKTSSIYKGVCWHKMGKKWMARIVVEKMAFYLGCFESEKDAALAYDLAALKYCGDFAKLNFPLHQNERT